MEKSQFKDIVAEFIANHRGTTMICCGECALAFADPLLVTVSGGADSVALLLVLRELGYSVVAAHCNFHLRGEESNRDERWVRTLATQLSVPLVVKHFDVEAYEREHGVYAENCATNGFMRLPSSISVRLSLWHIMWMMLWRHSL